MLRIYTHDDRLELSEDRRTVALPFRQLRVLQQIGWENDRRRIELELGILSHLKVEVIQSSATRYPSQKKAVGRSDGALALGPLWPIERSLWGDGRPLSPGTSAWRYCSDRHTLSSRLAR